MFSRQDAGMYRQLNEKHYFLSILCLFTYSWYKTGHNIKMVFISVTLNLHFPTYIFIHTTIPLNLIARVSWERWFYVSMLDYYRVFNIDQATTCCAFIYLCLEFYLPEYIYMNVNMNIYIYIYRLSKDLIVW